jgi:hypothetical protein
VKFKKPASSCSLRRLCGTAVMSSSTACIARLAPNNPLSSQAQRPLGR